MTKHSMGNVGVSPFFSSCKATLSQQLSGEKWDVGYLSVFCWAVLLCCFSVQCFVFCHNNQHSFESFTCLDFGKCMFLVGLTSLQDMFLSLLFVCLPIVLFFRRKIYVRKRVKCNCFQMWQKGRQLKQKFASYFVHMLS